MTKPEQRIEVGDDVTVHLVGSQDEVRGMVLYIPGSPGDSWIIQRTRYVGRNSQDRQLTEDIYYVQTFSYIELDAKAVKNRDDVPF